MISEAATGYLAGPVLVIGTGLLGASAALGLRRHGLDVGLRDASPTAQRVAVDLGAGHVVAAGEGFLPELVIVATPPDVVAPVVSAALREFPDAVVIDIASVKGSVLAALRADEMLDAAALARYVGAHPMAGRERSGPVAARGELFTAAPWVVVPHEGSSAHAVKVTKAAGADLGASVTQMDAAAHDQAVALISHFPQVASSLLASRLLNAPAEALALAGNGLRDTTRIAASDPGLWIQILSHNAGQLLPILQGLRGDLDRLITTLQDPQAPGATLDLAQLMSEGNQGQSRIPGKHGAPPQSFATVGVIVDDRPGQIARLLADIGEAGINLEDLRMEHSAGYEVGLIEVQVLPGRRDELVAALTALDWKVVQ
ncbi:prephenate dehydrogenase [Galactobacter caseinivorans]|uniref:Prephenate dehydrogenase n=1 Tax=Galactobacter caseinivorans TaxID=2676123 RepID=A0A496PKD3_9MICC|nr:prephenate dehydrogenase [Galactobacter caseinivorans]RKW70941.1 prephenate dehydrogenase [Galactobacter caseinivorans]